MAKPRLLDLFCGAGGCTRGYQLAGFYVVGVDINPQPHYVGDEFIQGDALEVAARIGHTFDAISASPPCQGYSSMRHVTGKEYPMLIDDVRDLLRTIGKPYAIENVEGSPLEGVTLCGTMFDLKVFRHRIFESNVFMLQPPHITHRFFGKATPQGRPATAEKEYVTVTGNFTGQDYARRAMGIDWMTRDELGEAIPPAYTEWIGQRLIEQLST